ncbi:Pfs1p SKDI_08G2300 [Saccharomyces kudriavzevii IFO 1802]|uniref:PFS1-like protein n=1 Tax=Saccharomyces kudriavzevii (strain ATCC MYA-4449 / AS 2.2408 / CBS 8840 / NBRC 1802 / NCYC 2889) TaxID=226230 RepID=A0AA35JK65_SACK1|nr:uncharacterized protein SKDI_08G2300 [Saccharomyces kudriavzevii IFO 1802]CAI4064132.1 hypothetical protein SKDI_08G2300 [Saccharomyces kudriavzevii IFO 1802]
MNQNYAQLSIPELKEARASKLNKMNNFRSSPIAEIINKIPLDYGKIHNTTFPECNPVLRRRQHEQWPVHENPMRIADSMSPQISSINCLPNLYPYGSLSLPNPYLSYINHVEKANHQDVKFKNWSILHNHNNGLDIPTHFNPRTTQNMPCSEKVETWLERLPIFVGFDGYLFTNCFDYEYMLDWEETEFTFEKTTCMETDYSRALTDTDIIHIQEKKIETLIRNQYLKEYEFSQKDFEF